MAVEAVVSAVAEKLVGLVIEEAKLLHGVQDQVDGIKSELQWMKCFLRDADEKQGGDERVKIWIANVRDVAYDVEDIIDTFILRKEQKRYASIFCNLIARHKFSNEIKGIRTKFHEISERRATYAIDNLGLTGEASNNAMKKLCESRRYSPHCDESDVIGLDDNLRTLKSRLVKSDLKRSVVSIVGMGGLGKTTLANKVYNNKDVIDHFQCRVWIYVSQAYSAKGLLEELWKNVMVSARDNLAVEQMEERLSVYLKEKRYLVVMDDVWEVNAWNSIKAALPVSKNGSRVLLTTRNREVARKVDSRSCPHELEFLSDKNSWILFLKKVGIEESECTPNLKELGKQIVNKCRGLPLAIVVLGSQLSGKEASYSAWSRLLERVGWQLQEDETRYSEILALSYINLPHWLKPCFIYFGLFPEDCEISRRRLIGLWLAEGLVQQRDAESPEDVAEAYIEELVDRSMIQVARRKSDGKIKTCRMYDLLRDLALLKAKEANFVHISENIESTSTHDVKIRRYAAHNNADISLSAIHHLRSYLVFRGVDEKLVCKFLDNGFQNKGFGLLRVLDLEDVRTPKLPEALGQLIHLRYLGLRRTGSGGLPSSLGNLRNLQTLDVKHSDINVSDRPIWQLQQLRHLYMNGETDSKIMHPPISSSSSSFNLKNLRTLWGVYIDGETRVEGGLDNSVHLKKLKVRGNLASQGESLSNWLVKLDRLEVLKLLPSDGKGVPDRLPTMKQFSNNTYLYKLHIEGRFAEKLFDVLEFPPNLTTLTLKWCELEEDPLPTLAKLQNLRTLTFERGAYTGKEMVCSSGGFQNLQVLKLSLLEKLETWKVEEGAMPSLKMLDLVYCSRLKMIPDGLQHITTLQELRLLYLPKSFTSRVQHSHGVDWYKIRHIPSIVINGRSAAH